MKSTHRARPLALGLALIGALDACEPTNEGFAPEQPLAYSHKTHAGERQMECQYCHFAAERGPYAGIPPLGVCAGCHDHIEAKTPDAEALAHAIALGEPIAWVRVHDLPDHVAFDHRPHVRAAIECQECHGPVETMERVRQHAPLTMGWCVDCHRARIAEEVPADSETGSKRGLLDCAVCHH